MTAWERGGVTRIYLTVDTELSSMHYRRHGASGLEDNFAASILGRTQSGDFGIVYQMARLDRFGLKGVFYVDPLVALVAGQDMVKRIVHPILDAGHDVQLHGHTEWLGLAATGPTDGRGGQNMANFGLEDQVRILDFAIARLTQAGAPMPVAFRAGNYGANDVTLRALEQVGIGYDSSYSPDYDDSVCGVSFDRDCGLPQRHGRVIEVPISAIASPSRGLRHAQITALSGLEMMSAIRHAARRQQPSFTIVSHSFELLCRDRCRPNRIVVNRFEQLCRTIASTPALRSATFVTDPPLPVDGAADHGAVDRLPHSAVRTLLRTGEQLVSNALYGEKINHIPVKAAVPAIAMRDRLITPMQNLVPLQHVALDLLMGV